jgi:hypothetical protein
LTTWLDAEGSGGESGQRVDGGLDAVADHAIPVPGRRLLWQRARQGEPTQALADAFGLPPRTVGALCRRIRLHSAEAIAPDGEEGDKPLVPPAVARVRALPGGRRLWFGDAAFCDYQLLGLLSAGGDHFVVRFKSSYAFYPDPGVPAREGRYDEGGRAGKRAGRGTPATCAGSAPAG